MDSWSLRDDLASALAEHGSKSDPNYWRYHPKGVESIKVKVVDKVEGAVARYHEPSGAVVISKGEDDPHTFAHEVGHRWESEFDEQMTDAQFTAGLGHYDPDKAKFIVGTSRYGVQDYYGKEPVQWFATIDEQNAFISKKGVGAGYKRIDKTAREYRNPSEAAADAFAYYVHSPDTMGPGTRAWVESHMTGDWPAIVQALRAHPDPRAWANAGPLGG